MVTKSVREKLLKMRIEEEKKEFEKLVERSEKAHKLSIEIRESFEKNKRLTSKDKEKLKNLEKLLRQIRRELRAGKPDSDKKNPDSVVTALEFLGENTSKLVKEVKKTTRHSVSVAAVQSSNTLVKLVKFLRFGK